MTISWDWFEKYFKWIAIIFISIAIISKIDLWINRTNESTFLTILNPFIKSLIGDFILLLIIILVALYFNQKSN